jgi:hypothetical protein
MYVIFVHMKAQDVLLGIVLTNGKDAANAITHIMKMRLLMGLVIDAMKDHNHKY